MTSKFHLLTLLFVSAIVMTSIIPNVNKLDGHMSNVAFAKENQTADLNQFDPSLNTVPIEPRGEEISDNENEQATDNETSAAIVDDNDQQNAIPDELEFAQNSTEQTPTNDNLTVIVDPFLNNTGSGGEVTLTNLKTIPQQVHVGDEFKIQATIQNNLNEPITYKGKTCGESPLNTKYDSKVMVNQLLHCTATSTDTLPPNGTATVESKGFEQVKAIAPGTSTVDVALYYNTGGSSSNTGIVPASLSFDIANGTLTNGTVTDNVVLSDFKINTFNATEGGLEAGTPFTWQAKVTNNLNSTIIFQNSCTNNNLGFYISDATERTNPQFCNGFSENPITLQPGEQAIAHGPGNNKGFEYQTSGYKTITLVLNYNLETLGGEVATVSKDFSFVVNPHSKVILSDLKTNPLKISQGTQFTYQVKVTNKMDVPVFFYNSCDKSDLRSGTSINDVTPSPNPKYFCDALPSNKVQLNPNEFTAAFGPDATKQVFSFNTAGGKKLQLFLSYTVGSPTGEPGMTFKTFDVNALPKVTPDGGNPVNG